MILNKKYIERLDLQEVDQIIATFRKHGIKNYKGKVVIQVDGYNDDPREIFEIPSIRIFYKKVFEKYPYLLYFLNNFYASDAWVLACLCETYQTITNAGIKNINLKMKFEDNLFSELIEKTAAFMNNIGENPRSILELKVRLAAMSL